MRTNAIRLAYPNVVAINGESEAWDQDGNVIEIDEALVATQLTKLQAEYDAQEYARNRQAEYPSITDVTVALAEKMEGNGQMWDEITALRLDVKSKYSKP